MGSDRTVYAPAFVVYTDNNLLTYVLTSAKLNGIGLTWVRELADFKFEIRYRPGKLNVDADSLSRLPSDFETYMDSCTERVPLECRNLCNSDIVEWRLNLAHGPDR